MRRAPGWLRLIVLVPLLSGFLGAGVTQPSIAVAAPTCSFTLGFKALRDMIPVEVGECLESERFNSANGNAEQRTTAWHGKGGLLVWRKADNWTAFTDGASTWINGPVGLQKRANGATFAWEVPAPTATANCALADDAVTIVGQTAQSDGSFVYRGTARNSCDSPIHLMVDVLEQSAPLADGTSRTLGAVPTFFVPELKPGEVRPIEVRAPKGPLGPRRVLNAVWLAGDDRNEPCLATGGSRCLRVDPWLVSAVHALGRLDEGRAMLRQAADLGVRLTRATTPLDVQGMYFPRTRTIVIALRLDAYSSWVRAATLAHELRHAIDHTDPERLDREQCLRAEEDAFRQQARVWTQLWNGQLPAPVDRVNAELNALTRQVSGDSTSLLDTIAHDYERECGRPIR